MTTRQERIEQHIARGLTPDEIVTEHGERRADVEAAFENIEACHRRTDWVTCRPPSRGCGTHAGFSRHRRHGEQPCAECRQAETAYNTGRRRVIRARGAA